MICAIHQPNFVSWLPFFDKMLACDVFIILTHCQFEKGGFQNRFSLGGKWYTMSVGGGLDLLTHKRYLNPESDWRRIVDSLPEYREVFDELGIVPSDNLVFMNTHIIQRLKNLLGLKCEVVMDHDTRLRGTERLVELCRGVKATKYLSGSGARAYLDESKFTDAGIEVEFQVIDESRKRSILEALNDVA